MVPHKMRRMSKQIRVLPELTINQIAAGEVIESPASVVKELVENAYDAGATHIAIEIDEGGLQLIRISDNGTGMRPDDAVLCLERYATSKINSFHDLLNLETMGFRGEALASIAAISKLTLTTATKDSTGTQVQIDGGKILKVSPCGRSQGTTIEVRFLFYNVPARKKFQKSSSSCAAEITRLITRLSLAWPEVGFTLISQGQPILDAPPVRSKEAYLERANQVLGKDFFSSTFKVAISEQGFQIHGLIGTPDEARANRHRQYLFVNKRLVHCPLIEYAIKDAYATRIAKDQHPTFLLYFGLSQELVDVNVHPQKKEIRFRDERLIRENITRSIPASFTQASEPVASPQNPHFAFPPQSSLPRFDAHAFKSFKLQEPDQHEADFILQRELPITQKTHRIIGLYSAYLMVDADSEMILVDLVAAYKRVLFDSLDCDPKAFQGQGLMIPLTLEFSVAEAQTIQTRLEEIQKMGISMRLLKTTTFIVEALPPFLDAKDLKEALIAFSSGYNSDSTPTKKGAIALVRFARARKKEFVLQEAIALFEKVLCSGALQCPDGKPIMHRMGPHEIAKLFKYST
jgi:DNA mismatch repair protein MutL